MKIGISLFANEKSREPTHADASWSDLEAMFIDGHREAACSRSGGRLICQKSKCPEKKVGAWSPVTYKPGTTRGNDNVLSVNALVLDLDHIASEATVTRLLDGLTSRGLAHIVHTTHSHSDDDQCLRVVLPLSRPVTAGLWRAFRSQVIDDLDCPSELDDLSDPARIYFLPSHPSDCDAWGASSEPGKPVDVDHYLTAVALEHASRLTPQPIDQTTTSNTVNSNETLAETGFSPPPADRLATPESVEIDYEDLIKRVADRRRRYAAKGLKDNHLLLDMALKGKPLAAPGGQSNALHKTACILASVFPVGTPSVAASEVLGRSIMAMGAGSEGLDHWFQKARESYERSMERRIEDDAKRAALTEGLIAAASGLRDLLPAITAAKDEQDAAVMAGDVFDETVSENAWMADLLLKPIKDLNAEPEFLHCEHNAVLLLTHLPEWKGAIRFNELTKSIDIVGGPLGEKDRHVSVLSTSISAWLHRKYNLKISTRNLEGPLLLVARRNSYDPLADYLNGLKWDGTARCSRILLDHANAIPFDASGHSIEDHVERITFKWMLSAAVRALRPGVQADSVLVLEGEMGSGKTAFFRSLAGDYYTLLSISLDSNDMALMTSRSWILEIGEMASLRKSSREAVNNAISATKDTARVAYARAVEDFPRRCVFGATTEDDDWLKDEKGSRRWWPVKVGKVDNSWILDNRDQLWAEAAHYAKEALLKLDELGGDSARLPEKLRWWLTGAEERLAHAIAAERYDGGTTSEAILAWWQGMEISKRPTRVTVSQVAQEALGATDGNSRRSLEVSVAKAMKSLGFVKSPRMMVNGTRTYQWTPDVKLRELDYIKRGLPLAALALVKATKAEGEK